MAVLTDVTARSSTLTWLTAVILCAAAIWLFSLRRKFRTLFLIPLGCIPFVTGIYFREQVGYDSSGFTVSMVLLLAIFVGGLLLDAFWSPYADDLADQTWLERFKE